MKVFMEVLQLINEGSVKELQYHHFVTPKE